MKHIALAILVLAGLLVLTAQPPAARAGPATVTEHTAYPLYFEPRGFRFVPWVVVEARGGAGPEAERYTLDDFAALYGWALIGTAPAPPPAIPGTTLGIFTRPRLVGHQP